MGEINFKTVFYLTYMLRILSLQCVVSIMLLKEMSYILIFVLSV